MGLGKNTKKLLETLKSEGHFSKHESVIELGSQDDNELGDELYNKLQENIDFIPSYKGLPQSRGGGNILLI